MTNCDPAGDSGDTARHPGYTAVRSMTSLPR